LIYGKAIRSNRYRGLQPKKCPLSQKFQMGGYLDISKSKKLNVRAIRAF
jgi:hypothetical protein